MSRGIDYSPPGSTVNRDPSTGIRYGVIPLGRLGEFAHESFEDRYDAACPHCGDEVPEDTHFTADNRPAGKQYGFWTICLSCEKPFEEEQQYGDEPSARECSDGEYDAHVDSSQDVWFTRSPYFTRAAFCSPCAPGACYLANPREDGERTYCPGPDWFDDENPAPFPIYSVATGELVDARPEPPSHEQDAGPMSARDMFPSDCPDRD